MPHGREVQLVEIRVVSESGDGSTFTLWSRWDRSVRGKPHRCCHCNTGRVDGAHTVYIMKDDGLPFSFFSACDACGDELETLIAEILEQGGDEGIIRLTRDVGWETPFNEKGITTRRI